MRYNGPASANNPGDRNLEKSRWEAMGTITNGLFCSVISPATAKPLEKAGYGGRSSLLSRKATCLLSAGSARSWRKSSIRCKKPESRVEEELSSGSSRPPPPRTRRVEDYNTVMKRMMRNPYEYHHDLGMNYTLMTKNLIVGSQPQSPEDIDHLKKEENVGYILCLQQDKDIEYWGIDIDAIIRRCKEVGIHHMRKPARDFDPDSLRNCLPEAVSSLEWAISEDKGRVYIHCTAGLGRAPAVTIAYLFWFHDMDLHEAYNMLTSKRPCGPNKKAIRGATYDLAKNDPWKEPFDGLPEHAFANIADWERKLIQERVRGLRGN
ncbi:hypothetical protein Taro_024964 [Colocasia esculenta]|uniref:Phosphoglucan phosphatase LSF2, chloroplastic n=1 Tax=Colocasia esculenta TaxID=4460 RepID=A0A843VLY3_COLES|nr:hypothetical protein [Colocasia esculenta]